MPRTASDTGALGAPSYLFVGEKPSLLAHERGYSWATANLAGRTLGDALDAVGISPDARIFLNLFGDHPDAAEGGTPEAAKRLRRIKRMVRGSVVVGMGQKVCRILVTHKIPHVAIVHPAARGKIRLKATYMAHVAEALGSAVPAPCAELAVSHP